MGRQQGVASKGAHGGGGGSWQGGQWRLCYVEGNHKQHKEQVRTALGH